MRYLLQLGRHIDRKHPTGQTFWEPSDYPQKDLLKHPVPENYIGTSTNKYLIELFENSWSPNPTLPTGYLPLLQDSPLTPLTTHIPNSLSGIDQLISYPTYYPLAARYIFKGVFDRFNVQYVEYPVKHDSLDVFQTFAIPRLVEQEILTKDNNLIYYFAVLYNREISHRINVGGIRNILRLSKERGYPLDEYGNLDLDSVSHFVSLFNENPMKAMPDFPPSEDWVYLYEVYLKAPERFAELLQKIKYKRLQKVWKMIIHFPSMNFDEILKMIKTVPKEWLNQLPEQGL